MEKRTSAFARIIAALALIAALVIVVVVVSVALNGSTSDGDHKRAHHARKEPKKPRTQAKTYTVKSGDTLIAIAHETGVPVAEILALNPEVDPQILQAGETLKLR
jgi:LysM repeat protein